MTGAPNDLGPASHIGLAADPATLKREMEATQAAASTLNGWVAGAQSLALLRGALASGLFEAARSPRTVAEIAEISGLATGWVEEVSAALVAHGIFKRVDNSFGLADDFARLAGPYALFGLRETVEVRSIEARTLEELGSRGDVYTALTSADQRAIARGVTFADPASPIVQARVGWFAQHLPEWHAQCLAGAHHAEFGCGVGVGVLMLLLMYPRLTAVGYEIDATVIAEARQRAAALGLDDRVEFRQADVRTIDETMTFDNAFWSQGFFPAESRSAALAAIKRALKPGGLLRVPGFEGGEPPATEEEGQMPHGRSYLRSRLVYQRWGIPTLTAQELIDEVETAGFEKVRVADAGLWRILLLRRP